MIVSSGFAALLVILVLLTGGTLVLLALSPVGRAIALRIAHGGRIVERDYADLREAHGSLLEEIEELRLELSRVADRVDFTERTAIRNRPLNP